MSDSAPLFGEESKGEKFLTYGVIVGLIIWGLFCVSIGIAFGILKNTTNLLLAASMIIASLSAILMFKWWRAEDLDPKFRLLLLLLCAQVLLIGVSLNVNIWVDRCPPTPADICMTTTAKTYGYVNPVFASGTIENQPIQSACNDRCPRGQGLDYYMAPYVACRLFNTSVGSMSAR